MFTRFIDIVNGLEALGKAYKEFEKVMKILRSLPRKWEAKITTIQEAKDLIKLPLKELIRSLITHDIIMKSHQDVEHKKENSIVFKASTYKEEVENESENEDFAIITIKFRKFMKGERFKGRRFTSKRDSQKKKAHPVSSLDLEIHLYCKVHKQLKYSMLVSRS